MQLAKGIRYLIIDANPCNKIIEGKCGVCLSTAGIDPRGKACGRTEKESQQEIGRQINGKYVGVPWYLHMIEPASAIVIKKRREGKGREGKRRSPCQRFCYN